MTDKFCRCGLRLSVMDKAGICLACQELPLPVPAVYVPPPNAHRPTFLPRDEQGRRKCCRCSAPAERGSYCLTHHLQRCCDQRERRARRRQLVTA